MRYEIDRHLNQKVKIEKLPKQAREKFESFLVNPEIWGQEVASLHPLDWQKFYLFIDHCYRHRVKISTSEMKELLLEKGFSDQLSEHTADIFSHGVELLKIAHES